VDLPLPGSPPRVIISFLGRFSISGYRLTFSCFFI
jgi:hypothetical protein